MSKERSGFMQALAVAGAYTAYHIGSGFATGNEIAQFFVSWGGVWPFIVFAVAALSLVVHAVFRRSSWTLLSRIPL